MPAIDDTPPIRIPLNALYRYGSRVLAYRGRAQDKLRQHLFVDQENVCDHMTDREFVERLSSEEMRPATPDELDGAGTRAGTKRLSLASPADLAVLAYRRRYVRAWVAAGRPARTERQLERLIRGVARPGGEGPMPGWRSLARWLEKWLAWGEDDEALLPGTGGNRTDRFLGKARALLTDTVTENYLVDTRPPATAVHRSVMVAFDKANGHLPETERMEVPGYQAVLDEISRIDRYTLEFCRVGRRSAEHLFRTVGSGPVTERHNQAWEIDHTTVDAIVIDPESGMPIGRPRVTPCLDRHTRCCTGITIGFEPPSAAVSMECLAMAVMPKDKLLSTIADIGTWPCFGAPAEIVSDQGGDFRSAAFKAGCLLIGTDVEHSPLLKAWYRGRIERFIKTLSREVFHRVPGTTFSSFFLRNKEAIPESVAVCTLDELWEYMIRYIVDVYNRKPHRALGGKSPLELWNESVRINGLRPPPTPQRLRQARSLPETRTLQRYGIEIDCLVYQSHQLLGLRVRQDCPRLVKVLQDRDDLTRIRVIHPFDGTEIIVPIRPDLEAMVRGVSLAKHRLGRALQRQNPERLAGLAGLRKCYRMLDEAMAAKRRHGGLRNAMHAARYFEALARARPVDAPPVVDANASGRSFVEDVMDDEEEAPYLPAPTQPTPVGQAVSPEVGAADVAADAPVAPAGGEALPPKPGGRRARPGKKKAAEAAGEDGPIPDPSDDLDDLVSSLDLNVSQRKENQR